MGRKISTDELQVDNSCDSLKTYLDKFQILISAIQTQDGLRAATFDLIRQASEENVRYLEIRFAPLLSVSKRFTADQVLDAVIEGIQEGYRRFGVRAQIIACCMRHHSLARYRLVCFDILMVVFSQFVLLDKSNASHHNL